MKSLFVYLFLACTCLLHAQVNPVTIDKEEVKGKVLLKAINSSEEAFVVTLTVKSRGMDIPSPKVITKEIKGLESIDMITMTAQPGVAASYNYKLSVQQKDPQLIVTEQSRRRTTSKTVIGNSSTLRSQQAKKNVEANIVQDALTIFVKEGCGRCHLVTKMWNENEVEYNVINTSESKDKNQLMWDALHVYGEKEGRITFPVIIYKDKIHHTIQDLESMAKDIAKIK